MTFKKESSCQQPEEDNFTQYDISYLCTHHDDMFEYLSSITLRHFVFTWLLDCNVGHKHGSHMAAFLFDAEQNCLARFTREALPPIWFEVCGKGCCPCSLAVGLISVLQLCENVNTTPLYCMLLWPCGSLDTTAFDVLKCP